MCHYRGTPTAPAELTAHETSAADRPLRANRILDVFAAIPYSPCARLWQLVSASPPSAAQAFLTYPTVGSVTAVPVSGTLLVDDAKWRPKNRLPLLAAKRNRVPRKVVFANRGAGRPVTNRQGGSHRTDALGWG